MWCEGPAGLVCRVTEPLPTATANLLLVSLHYSHFTIVSGRVIISVHLCYLWMLAVAVIFRGIVFRHLFYISPSKTTEIKKFDVYSVGLACSLCVYVHVARRPPTAIC